MAYAKLLSESAIDRNVPHKAYINNRLVVGELPADYLATQGFYPLEESDAPTPREGYHMEPRYAYDDAETPTTIVESWVEVENPPPPPRTFSKFLMVQALMAANLWPQVKAWIEANNLTDLYLAAQVFTDDNEYFTTGVTALKQALGVTDEQVEAILQAALIE